MTLPPPPPPPIVYQKFECAGDGLSVFGHYRASPADITLALEPEFKEPRSWWEAQIRLYGLKCSKWTIDGMKKVFSQALESGLQVSGDMDALEKKLNEEYAKLKKESQITVNKPTNDSKGQSPDLSASENSESQDSVELNAFDESCQTRTDAIRARQLAKMNREHAALLTSPQGAGKNVYGTWQLDCPGIISEFCLEDEYRNSNITWVIHPPIINDAHLWCAFKQIVVEGVIRIEWKSVIERNNWKKRKNKFYFRGITPGDGDYCCDDEWNKGWIVFDSEHECHGVFETQFGDAPWEFTGKKISLKVSGKRTYSLRDEYRKLGKDWLKSVLI